MTMKLSLKLTSRKIFLLWVNVIGLSYQQSFAQPNQAVDSLMNVLKTSAEDSNKVKTFNNLSRVLVQTKQFATSRKYADEAMGLAEKLKYRRGIAYACYNIGLNYEYQGNKADAIKYFLAELEIWKELGDQDPVAYLNVYIGEIYYQMNNYPESRKRFLAALKIAQEMGNKWREIICYNYLGNISLMEGNYSESLKNYFTALKISQERKDTAWITVFYNNIGNTYLELGNLSGALEYNLFALKLNEDRKNVWQAGGNHHNIGEIYISQGNLSEALKHLQAALEIAEDGKDLQRVAGVRTSIGKLHKIQRNYPEALNNHLEALKIWKKEGQRYGEADSYNEIGEIFKYQGNLTEAEKNHRASLEICKEIGYKKGIGSSYINLGQLYISLQKYPEAKENLFNGVSISEEIGSKELIKNAYEALTKLDSATGNYPQALRNYKLYSLYKDSLLNETNSKQIAQMKEQYESEKKDKEILKLSSDKQKLESEKQIHALLLRTKEDSLNIVHAENDKVQLENEKMNTLNLFNQQRIGLLGNEKKIQQLQNDKDKADLTVQKAEADKKQEQLVVLNKEKAIRDLQLKRQTQAKNYFIAGLILFAVLGFFIYRTYHTRQRLKLLSLRNKIASDLHDDVGSTLSSISIFSKMAQQQSKETIPMLETIGESSRKMLEAMADIVWTINPENDQFEKIISRMKSFAYELLGAKNIDFEFVAEDDVSKMKLPMEVRKNLYLIFKEATNNMVKYAQAQKAMFVIKGEKNNLTMTIRDDGKGFDLDKLTGGNGLKNMKKRAGEIGAKLVIDSFLGNGTTIHLSVAV
jgi:two-component system, NarL family, sensor histidine kinase UhpB